MNKIHEQIKKGEKPLTRGEELKKLIKDSGVSIVFLADKLGCSRGRIYAILDNAECSASEIAGLSKWLHMTNEQRDHIFLSE